MDRAEFKLLYSMQRTISRGEENPDTNFWSAN